MIPVKPEPRRSSKVILAKGPGYIPLIANFDGWQVETKRKLSWRERLDVLFRGSIYLSLLTFGHPLQPIMISVRRVVNDGVLGAGKHEP